MRRVFVDTGGFFALIAREDPHHASAKALFEHAARESWRLVTTNAVVIECYTLLLTRSRPARRNALGFLGMIETDAYAVERVRETDEQQAIALVRRHQDKTYSLCDALSFVVMERLELIEVIAFDRHFRDYGRFTLL
ncbi:MAG: type II toxin-antitoxin system VapC family toxin [Candidatus Riflebacteria bacterium]|nr:type II toxin-antitoxin system VapC family toxin [Candidatus Riflebacteria bacterium]